MGKKRVCIDISNIIPGKGGSGGGIATYTFNLIKGINQLIKINELEIYCIKHPDFNGFDNLNNIKVINTRIKNKTILQRIYWTHIYLPFFCIRNRINLLHKVTPELPLFKVCSYMCTLHDLMFDFYLSNKTIKKNLKRKDLIKFYFFKIVTKHAILISNTIIVPSYSVKEELIEEYRIKNDKVHVSHEAVEKRNDIKKKSGTTGSEKLHMGVIAAFSPHKGHLKVLEMAHKFIQSGFTNFKISFRGVPAFPNYLEEIISLRQKLCLNDHVFIVPFDPKAKLGEIYSEFNLVLLLSEYEGFGLPVLEAQSYNLPVFCSDIPVFREILGNSGYFIPNNLSARSIKKIIADLNDQNLLNTLKMDGTSNLNKYSWEKMSAETIHLYKRT